jgi:hypothetical protein
MFPLHSFSFWDKNPEIVQVEKKDGGHDEIGVWFLLKRPLCLVRVG